MQRYIVDIENKGLGIFNQAVLTFEKTFNFFCNGFSILQNRPLGSRYKYL